MGFCLQQFVGRDDGEFNSFRILTISRICKTREREEEKTRGEKEVREVGRSEKKRKERDEIEKERGERKRKGREKEKGEKETRKGRDKNTNN